MLTLIRCTQIELCFLLPCVAINSDIESKERELVALHRDFQSISHRNSQLEDCLSRLTKKCEGWAESYRKVALESECIKEKLAGTTNNFQENSKKQQEEVNYTCSPCYQYHLSFVCFLTLRVSLLSSRCIHCSYVEPTKQSNIRTASLAAKFAGSKFWDRTTRNRSLSGCSGR